MNLSDHDPDSLRQAIVDTQSGGTVDFQAGLSGTITLTTGELLIAKDLTIAGPGASVITVSGNHASRVFNIAAPFTVTISGLTIADGLVTGLGFGGGIFNSGTLTVTSSTINGNRASTGGGILNFTTGSLIVTSSTLSGNIAQAVGMNNGLGGGIFTATGRPLSLTDSTLRGNIATYFGGGIQSDGPLDVTDCTLSGNSVATCLSFARRLEATDRAFKAVW